MWTGGISPVNSECNGLPVYGASAGLLGGPIGVAVLRQEMGGAVEGTGKRGRITFFAYELEISCVKDNVPLRVLLLDVVLP